MTHPPTVVFAPRTERAERRLWTVLAALFALVAGVNWVLALSEGQWWQGAVAALFVLAGTGCARIAHRTRA
ncbi:hypothetical protein [Saccharothrix australiensis]|uniref:Uncharacterized protein n=1 Tax=Saccharothrix australiensis TaxID=2072 RepID=A0A495W4Z2_9PSEU|nr:hypothetical protein [Saccharothrix australiensis]RKT56200.1 hypothetical protein C8E97_4889 [Saccharothrix australiensis]